MSCNAPEHIPVLRRTVVELFAEHTPGTIVDGTVGLGGHTAAILDALPTVRVVGIDQDDTALAEAQRRLNRFGERVTLVHGNVRDVAGHLDALEIGEIGGMLLDLGVSSLQLDDADRGFSFRTDGPLDMRMNRRQAMSATAWLSVATEDDIGRALRDFGEERYWRRIARAIVSARGREPIETTSALRRIVHSAVPSAYFRQRIDPATRTFQAIRLAVNDELAALSDALAGGWERLADRGLLVVISFHSLEDRVVKQFMREKAATCVCPPGLPECMCGKRVEAEILTKKPMTPTASEIDGNPRARSAKLRACLHVV